MTILLKEEIIKLEKQLWDVIKNNDIAQFKTLVADDALMVIGGMRSSGAEEARYISQVNYPSYELSDFRIIKLAEDTYLLHYTATFTGEHSSFSDFSGSYYVSSIWKKNNDNWQLVFNQDVRPAS